MFHSSHTRKDSRKEDDSSEYSKNKEERENNSNSIEYVPECKVRNCANCSIRTKK